MKIIKNLLTIKQLAKELLKNQGFQIDFIHLDDIKKMELGKNITGMNMSIKATKI